MSKTAQLRGEFWPQDHWGRVTNAAVPREQAPVQAIEAAEEAADLALERYGDRLHSVYLSGPAARGRRGGAAIFVLLRVGSGTARGRHEEWECAVTAELRRRHPDLGRIVIAVFEWKEVFTADNVFSPARFRLAVNSICVAGRNMSRMLAPQRLDMAVMNQDILNLRARLSNASARALASRGAERVKAAAMDAGAAVLAAAFALVMEREQIYTEDLDLRRDLFLLDYPGRTRDIHRAYRMATRPSGDPDDVTAFVERVNRWLTPMADAWLNANNPQRAERLKA
ncbi:MAG: hypothetical protein R3C52_06165 [Hyphomonadaceae bacterium]